VKHSLGFWPCAFALVFFATADLAGCSDDGGGSGPNLCEGVDCDDKNECTVDGSCKPETGLCDSTPVADGTSCGRDAGMCQEGSCLVACSEEGINDAIAAGGGPYIFACEGPTVLEPTAQIVIDNDVILDGEGNLTLDGDESQRVLSVVGEVTAELRGFAFIDGGGILNAGTLTISSTTVSGNTAEFGGGIGNTGFLTLIDSTVSDNTALTPQQEGLGGGIGNTGFLTLIDSAVSDNTAHKSGGGIGSSGFVQVENSTVSGNIGHQRGGGIDSSSGTVTLVDSTVSGNTAGFGVFQGFGAGIGESGGTVTLTRSTVSGNTAVTGGGGISFTGTVTLTNSTVSGNTAGSVGGGGIFNAVQTAVLTLTSSTVSGNTADNGGSGIVSAGTVTLKSTVIEGDCEVPGSMSSRGGNIESPGNTCGLDPSGTDDQVNVTSGELNLGPLRDNGGPTLTQAPLANSVAIDVMPTQDCIDAEGERLETDQRGVNRPQGPRCDAGAVEVDGQL
jgi:predicted outer membrane repeat protein